jgi:hypothetical protein
MKPLTKSCRAASLANALQASVVAVQKKPPSGLFAAVTKKTSQQVPTINAPTPNNKFGVFKNRLSHDVEQPGLVITVVKQMNRALADPNSTDLNSSLRFGYSRAVLGICDETAKRKRRG